jgi:hypothetical protein
MLGAIPLHRCCREQQREVVPTVAVAVVEIEQALDRARKLVERALASRRSARIVERVDPAKSPVILDEAQDRGNIERRMIHVIALCIR